MVITYKYEWHPQEYTTAQQVETKCNDIFFVNAGTSICYINGYPLAAGTQLVWTGYTGEMNIGYINISFAPGGTNSVWIHSKKYI